MLRPKGATVPRTITLTDAEAQAIADIVGNALEQDHDTFEGDYFWFLLTDEESVAYDQDDDREVARERWRERFEEVRATVTSALEKVSGPLD